MEKKDSISSHDGTENVEDVPRRGSFGNMDNLSAVFENPLKQRTKEELLKDVAEFCTAEDKNMIEREQTHRWSHPFMLYWLCCMCSMAAAVQGMDETVNNGAQALYLADLDIAGPNVTRFSPSMQDNITGLVVGAPYLCCAILGCWLTEPLNKVLGRRGTIFISCFIAAVASIWEGVANSWVNLFIARFVLGLGIGPKSSTVPVYAAECSPAPIRGALVMRKSPWRCLIFQYTV
jgi:hypothetical protein